MRVWYSQFTTHAKFAHTVEPFIQDTPAMRTLIHKTHAQCTCTLYIVPEFRSTAHCGKWVVKPVFLTTLWYSNI